MWLSRRQQRKARDAKIQLVKTIAGSLIQYFKKPDDGQGSSNDVNQDPVDNTGAPVSSIYCMWDEVEMTEVVADEQ